MTGPEQGGARGLARSRRQQAEPDGDPTTALRTTRRELLKAAALAAAAPLACGRWPPAGGGRVNDVHSRLNETRVAAVFEPGSLEELRELVRRSAREGRALALAGGRHSMGGQQFLEDGWLVDTRAFSRVLSFDRERGLLEAEAGIEWPELVERYLAEQEGSRTQWGIRQKQTGADRFTLGGSLSANAHGRGLTFPPLVSDVESVTVLDADGELRRVDRSSGGDLFSLVAGGYGLFGVLYSVELRLAPRRQLERVVEVLDRDPVMDRFQDRIDEGFLYGDLQFDIDPASPGFLRRGVFSCYRPVPGDTPIPAAQDRLSAEDWGRLLIDAHRDKSAAFERYAEYYLGTSGQIYWSDLHQMSFYRDDYHRLLDRVLEGPPGTEMISELYVPRGRYEEFMAAAAETLREEEANPIYGTVRLIEEDRGTFLPWAREPWACVVINLHVEHTPEGKERAARAFRALIDRALERQGSYFLTYHRWAGRRQVEAAHPRFAAFLEQKLRVDPRERFQSDWYRHHKELFGR